MKPGNGLVAAGIVENANAAKGVTIINLNSPPASKREINKG